ncbi:Na+/H+ antiporter subunit E, partial [candidate division WOR-3 bacterium]|nr:Na+/H+ antiporter subunit E [candidate division WOR-3 bacterium]
IANFDVAYRVVHPALPIHPGIVRVKTSLKSEMARTMLANSITLTPGTLSVDMVGDNYYIHWINIFTDDPEKQRLLIISKFEWMLRKVFE